MNEIDRCRPLRWGLTLVLGLTALGYLAKGFEAFVWHDPQDLRQFWVWQQYLTHGRYPPDVVVGHGELYGAVPIRTGRNDALDPNLGPPPATVYPPWIFFTEFIFVVSNWRATCLLLGAWNLLALALALIWAYRVGARWGKGNGWLLAASVAAVSSICTTLRNGQVGLLTFAFLLAAMLLEGRKRAVPAGILMGLAALKPTITGPFFLIYLARRRFGIIATAAAYIAIAMVTLWIVTGAGPLEMMREMSYSQKTELTEGYGPDHYLRSMGLSFSMSTAIPAIAGVVIGLAIAAAYRRIPMLPLMGMMSVISRLWAYHRMYDNLALIFLLVAIGERMLARKDGFSRALFLLIGLSLWLPARATAYEFFQAYQMLVWGVGLIGLCIVWRHSAGFAARTGSKPSDLAENRPVVQ
jgi:hypothetical protein